jgi:hypothetical protein
VPPSQPPPLASRRTHEAVAADAPAPADDAVAASASEAPEPGGAGAVQAAANGAGHAASSAAAAAAASLNLDGLRAVWPAVVETVRSENGFCAALLARAMPIAFDGTELIVAFEPADDAPFLLRKVNDDEYRQCVVAAVRTVTGSRVRISYVLTELPTPEQHAGAAAAPPTEDEWVRRFMAEFDAEEIVAEPHDPGSPSESEAS